MRGLAFDLPGLGLADRPSGFDYTWTGLGRFAVTAIDDLDIDRFHLVVHDTGGPVGFEVAAALPERIGSITVLNAPVVVDAFRRPWVMEPFAHRWVGSLSLRMLTKPLFRWLMGYLGIGDRSQITNAELDAYLDLLRRGDGGRAFLEIMRGFELTREKRELYAKVLRNKRYPVRIVWGKTTRRSRSRCRVSRRASPPDSTRSSGFPASTSSRRTRLRPWPRRFSRLSTDDDDITHTQKRFAEAALDPNTTEIGF